MEEPRYWPFKKYTSDRGGIGETPICMKLLSGFMNHFYMAVEASLEMGSWRGDTG